VTAKVPVATVARKPPSATPPRKTHWFAIGSVAAPPCAVVTPRSRSTIPVKRDETLISRPTTSQCSRATVASAIPPSQNGQYIDRSMTQSPGAGDRDHHTVVVVRVGGLAGERRDRHHRAVVEEELDAVVRAR